MKAGACVFCRILDADLPGSIVFRDELCVAFMDIQPVNSGHVLVVPVKHVHVHLHVIPRYAGDVFGFRFGANYTKLPSREELDAAAAQIRAAL